MMEDRALYSSKNRSEIVQIFEEYLDLLDILILQNDSPDNSLNQASIIKRHSRDQLN